MLTMLIPQVHSQVETLLFKQKEHPVCNIIWRVGQLKMVRHLSGLEGWCPSPLQMRLARIPPGKRGGHGNPVTARLQAPVTLLQQQWKKYTYHHTYLNCRGGWVGQATREQASNSHRASIAENAHYPTNHSHCNWIPFLLEYPLASNDSFLT